MQFTALRRIASINVPIVHLHTLFTQPTHVCNVPLYIFVFHGRPRDFLQLSIALLHTVLMTGYASRPCAYFTVYGQ